MGPLQKLLEIFSQVGNLKIMLMPVMIIFGSIAAGWYFLADFVGPWVLIGLTLLILAGGAAYLYYRFVRPWRLRRKAAAVSVEPEVEEIPEISDEEFRQALKIKFDKGVVDLVSFRKDADKLPLYLVVGEKGCGKSEAIRRSGIGFPAGLTNTEQGVGGTDILDWWITNRSVMLDLPGAHFFGRGGKSEALAWKLLLKHISDFRPSSPLNGIILTISAEQLLADTDDDINSKSARLIEHFENIHRALGTQVPVFVLVTKADRLCGFLEYFSDLSEQGSRDQIFGWSSAENLEDPFSPERYRTDNDGIFARLRQRRDSLLQYSIESKSLAYKRRVQVNHLYEFPRSYKAAASRLGLYLERLFEPNSWYCDPFFLRGTYYTSAIQRESELDPSLARALGKSLEELPAAELRHTEDSYFLKETLNNKVFCEGGLVTWNHDTRYQKKRSRARFILVAAVLLAVFTVYTVWVSLSWQQEMEGKHNDWSAVQSWLPEGDDIVARKAGSYTYNGGLPVVLNGVAIPDGFGRGGENLDLYELPALLQTGWIEDVETPLIFRPIDLFNRKLKSDMVEAYRGIFEYRYVAPLVVATEKRILSEEELWTETGTNALGQLLRIEAFGAKAGPKLGTQERKVQLDSFFKYVLDDLSVYSEHVQKYNNYVRDIYHDTPGVTWPPEAFIDENAREGLEGATESGVKQFKKAMDYYVSRQGAAFEDLRTLLSALADFRDSESLLWKNALASGDPDSVHQIDVILESWYRDVGKLSERRKALDDVLVTLFADRDVDVVQLCDSRRIQVTEYMESQYYVLEKELANVLEKPADETAKHHIEDVKQTLTAHLAASKEMIKTEVAKYLADFDGLRADNEYLHMTEYQDFRRYQLRTHVYGFLQSSEYVVGEDIYDPFDYLLDLEELQKAFDESVRDISGFDTNSDSFNSGREAADKMLNLIYRQQRYKVVEQIVQALPITTGDFARMVSSRVEAQWLERPEIPLTPDGDIHQFDDGFNTEVVYDLLTLWDHMDDILRQERLGKDSLPDVERLKRSFKEKDQVFKQYLTEYVNYWTRTVDQNTEMVQFATWKEFHNELNQLEVYNVNHKLRILFETALYAIGIVPSTHPGQTEAQLDISLKMKGLTEEFDAECLRVLDAWKAIENVDRVVMNEVLIMSASDFKAAYLSLLDNNVNKANFGFWNSLCTQAVRLLADEGEHLSRYYLTNLATRYRGFPLINDIATPALSPESFDEALELVRHIKQGPKEENPDTMMGGDRTGWPDVDKEIDRLQGGKVLRTEYERDWFDQLVKVMEFIEGDEPLTCELVVLPRETQSIRPPRFPAPRPTSKVFGDATWVYRYMRINGTAFNTEPTTYVVGHEGKTYPMAPDASQLAIHFYYTSEDLNPGVNSFARPSGVAGLEMDWLPLVVLHMGDSVVLDDKVTCAVPFRVVDNAEHKDSEYFYWLGFKFNKEIPDLKAWPSPSNWPHLRRSPRDLGGAFPDDESTEGQVDPEAPLLPLQRDVAAVEPVQTNATMDRVSEKIKQVNSAPAPATGVAPPYAPAPMAPAPVSPSAALGSDDDYIYAPALPADAPETYAAEPAPSTVPPQVTRTRLYSPAGGQRAETIYQAPRPAERPVSGYSPSDRAYAPAQMPVMTPPPVEIPKPPSPVVPVETARPVAPQVPVVEPATVKRNPPVVPAPERPLYTTEVTFDTPRPATAGPTPPGGNAIVGTEPPKLNQDPVSNAYSVTEGGGYEAVKSKKKTSPSPVTQRANPRGRR